MVFKNESQLKNFLLQKCKSALMDARDEVYLILDRFMKEFYADYDPVMYERTNQLLRSLVVTEILPTKNGYKTFIYFDLGRYETGAEPDGQQVISAAAWGGHGATGLKIVSGRTNADIWYTPTQLLSNEAIQILKRRLISAGIPIK